MNVIGGPSQGFIGDKKHQDQNSSIDNNADSANISLVNMKMRPETAGQPAREL